MLALVRNLDANVIPEDIRPECLHGIAEKQRARKGDYLVVWGAGSVCAGIAMQLARLAGVKVVAVGDVVKHGARLMAREGGRPDFLVDAKDAGRAVEVVRAYTRGKGARFGFDTQGKETAGYLMDALATSDKVPAPSSLRSEDAARNATAAGASRAKVLTPPSTPSSPSLQTSHLVGLTGLPKENVPKDVALHSVPIKLYHEVPQVGEALSAWCERLLVKGLLVPPEVVGTVDGLEGVNAGLDRMRRREVSGGRLVAVLE
jgi:threonine dehydrogenase-like Zn-dependent dehydrogenase